MTIETKYNIGDEVWIKGGGHPLIGHIEYMSIHIHIGQLVERVTEYTIRGEDDKLYATHYIYDTLEDCINDF